MKCQLTFISYKWTETFNGRTIICFHWISAMTINWLTGKNMTGSGKRSWQCGGMLERKRKRVGIQNAKNKIKCWRHIFNCCFEANKLSIESFGIGNLNKHLSSVSSHFDGIFLFNPSFSKCLPVMMSGLWTWTWTCVDRKYIKYLCWVLDDQETMRSSRMFECMFLCIKKYREKQTSPMLHHIPLCCAKQCIRTHARIQTYSPIRVMYHFN